MRLRPQALLGLFVLALAVWALWSTREWAIKTALYPRAIGIPLLLLAAIEVVSSLRAQGASSTERAMDFEMTADIEPKVALQRTIAIFVWISGFFLAIIVLGFPFAIPLFVFAYLKGQAKEGWFISLVLAGLAWILFYALFVRLLHLPFLQGLFFRLLE